MFDKTINLNSTDGAVILSVTAGTEGVKYLTIKVQSSPSLPAQSVSEQELMDIVAPAIEAWWAKKLSP